ncbi:MAG: hypothetical protein JSR37_02605 [Verrucomicrobia bacterium]|nr:hypothetical protein [Verrucomicrobiota bacterium]
MLKAFSLVKFLIPKEQIVGVSLDGSVLRSALVAISGTDVSIKKLEVDSEELPKNIPIASALSSTKTIARSFEIALTKQKDLDATFSFEAESHLPYPQELSIIDKVILAQANGSTSLQLFSVLKTDLQHHLDALYEKAIDPELICPKPLALCHFVKQLYMATGLHIVLHIDATETTCLLIQDGLPLMARSHPVGLDTLQAITYVDENGQTTINENELENLHQYIREISRILLAFQNGFDTAELPLLFAGPVVENQILLQLFTSALQRSLAPAPEKISSETYSWQDLLVYSAPIGAALALHLEQKGQSINLRKDEFAYSDKWRRWKKELTIYFCFMALLAGTFYLYGQTQLKQKENALVEQYATLLQVMEKPAAEDEFTNITSDIIAERLDTLETELKLPSDEMALHPDVARVSDLLAWLASHPNVVINGDDPKAISLESLVYNMVKRPEKGKLKEHYQVRVELEFSSPSPTMARELHDALLTPNPFIDPKNELKWSVHRGHFKAIFFLKDRTKYPQEAA